MIKQRSSQTWRDVPEGLTISSTGQSPAAVKAVINSVTLTARLKSRPSQSQRRHNLGAR